ncbi:MAG: S66 peptidase family protein [Polyangiaceae bacterium]
MPALTMPAPLRPGDTLAVVAPSSPFGLRDFWQGLAWLRDRYRIVASPGVLDRKGYLAGSDERRRGELVRAMTDPDVRAIIAARGGYGATRILADLPWDRVTASPRWIVGFSDVTALHVKANALGIASVHGPHVTGLGRALPETRAAFLRALERPAASHEWRNLVTLQEGRARGVICGGNLSLLHALAASGDLSFPADAIVAIEDVTEGPYRVDRMLTSLISGGHFSRARAIVFGGFTQCDPGPDGVTIDEVLRERTASLKVPVLAGAPFGHEDRNLAFVLGAEVAIEKNVVRF